MANYLEGRFVRLGVTIILLLMFFPFLASCGVQTKNHQEAASMNSNRDTITSNTNTIRGKNIASMLLDGEYKKLYQQFSISLKDIVKLEQFSSMGQSFVADIVSFKQISNIKLNGSESFVWNDQSGGKGLTATIDSKGMITGIQIIHYTNHPKTDEAYSKTKFDLPFKEEWLVIWGGKNIFVNYHYEYEQVRYAYDFVKEKNGYSYKGNPNRNENYFAFNKDVLAPADGIVVAYVDGILDNSPVGKVNESQPAGNFITIKHSNGEYSTVAHLKNGSVKVKSGDKVTAGQLIGKCGNSGNSTEPHIHFQVSTTIDQSNTTTIPISFLNNIQLIRGDSATGTINKK
ncbi:M23 family metallopeptidase [Bacillus sp. JJ664]